MNGGYDPEALMQQYRNWEGQQWQPPAWGQPPVGEQPSGITWGAPPMTIDKSRYPNFYPSPWQVPIAEAERLMVDESLAEYLGAGPVGSDVPPISTSIQAPQIALPQAPGGPIWTPSLRELVEQSPELSAKAWKAAEYSPWEAMADQARHLIGTQREATETFREAPSWQAGGELLGSSIDTLGEFPSVPWAGAKRGLLKLKELTTGPAGKQFFQDLFQDGPFTEEAKGFFDKELDIGIAQPYGRAMPCREGGYYVAGTDRQPPLQPSLTYLQTANRTTAIHELSHTWWEPRRQEKKDAFVEAMIRFADESKQQQFKTPAQERAILSVWGHSFPPFYAQGARIPTEDDSPEATDHSSLGAWGPITDKTQWNDHEMFAYMAMTIADDIDAVPPYLRQFFEGLFTPVPHQDTLAEHVFTTPRDVVAGWGRIANAARDFPAGGWGHYGIPPPEIQKVGGFQWGMRPPALY